MVDTSCFLVERGSSSIRPSGGVDYGCQFLGLAGNPERFLFSSEVVCSGKSQVLQLEGVDGSLEGSVALSGVSEGSLGVGEVGQPNDFRLLESPSGDKMQGFASSCKGSFSLGRSFLDFFEGYSH